MIEETFIFSANTKNDVFGEIERRVQWTLGISNTIIRRTGSNFKLFYKTGLQIINSWTSFRIKKIWERESDILTGTFYYQ